MQAALAQKGTHVSLRTVYRTMSEAGLIHRHRRPHGITKADTETQNRENLIKRNFTAAASLKKRLLILLRFNALTENSMFHRYSTASMVR